ncbi:hypothetical protein CEXT_233371 [Caerostris extrusa]|uniref:Uncharacterized protein n=1 Tax=Caerostris extrusa TaxID=172846 RepID=A0AAV4WST3_CAEEX|nr:hypothetical protein CEXT_233371 [Caerostris extrusa]
MIFLLLLAFSTIDWEGENDTYSPTPTHFTSLRSQVERIFHFEEGFGFEISRDRERDYFTRGFGGHATSVECTMCRWTIFLRRKDLFVNVLFLGRKGLGSRENVRLSASYLGTDKHEKLSPLKFFTRPFSSGFSRKYNQIQDNNSRNRNSRFAVRFQLTSLHSEVKGHVFFISKKALGSRFGGIGSEIILHRSLAVMRRPRNVQCVVGRYFLRRKDLFVNVLFLGLKGLGSREIVHLSASHLATDKHEKLSLLKFFTRPFSSVFSWEYNRWIQFQGSVLMVRSKF